MAKVTIDAIARIRNGVMTDEDFRTYVLTVFGKNDKLLADVRDVFLAGVVNQFARPFTYRGTRYFAKMTYHADLEVVEIKIYNTTDPEKCVGAGVYGKTKFFSVLDVDTSNDEE